MGVVPLSELETDAAAYDAWVARADVADAFCTRTAWILPAYQAFSADADARIHRYDEGWVPLMELRTVLGRTWMPLEASWGLACPFVADDPQALVKAFLGDALAEGRTWNALFLSGLVRGGPTFHAIVRATRRRWRLGVGQATQRCVASLDGGRDAFLARRTPKFRKNLRRALRRAPPELTFALTAPDTIDDARAAFARILAIEETSWKAAEGHGIDDGPMRSFYADMVPRLAREGRLRVTFAQLDGDDVGYVLGGVLGTAYRGLQISFDHRLADLSLGNLLQWSTVQGLCDEGIASYDLGTDMAYKRRWAEQLVETVPLVVR